jgi:hypothetical protein
MGGEVMPLGSFLTRWFKHAPPPQRLQQARAQAEGYHAPPADHAPEAAPRPSVRSEAEWVDLVGRRIEEAMRAGAFDNLPGHGKPLHLDREPFIPEDQQLANKLLRNNDLTPAWIAERAELHGRIDRLRARLAAAHAQRGRALQAAATPAERAQAESRWQQAVGSFTAEVRDLNRRIMTLNLKQPVAHLEILQIRLDEEIARLSAD